MTPLPGRRATGRFAALLALAACGGGSGGTDGDPDAGGGVGLICEEPSCRGDLTGEWSLSGACLDTHQVEDSPTECPEWICRVVEADASGSLVFGADGHAELDLTATTRSECHVPLSCLDPGETCASFAADRPDRTCTDAGDACDCVEAGGAGFTIAGDWQVIDDRTLEVRNETSMAGGNDWCVQGDELRITWLVGANSSTPVTRLVLVGARSSTGR